MKCGDTHCLESITQYFHSLGKYTTMHQCHQIQVHQILCGYYNHQFFHVINNVVNAVSLLIYSLSSVFSAHILVLCSKLPAWKSISIDWPQTPNHFVLYVGDCTSREIHESLFHPRCECCFWWSLQYGLNPVINVCANVKSSYKSLISC